MPSQREVIKMGIITIGVMFTANLLASQSPTARRFIRGASAQDSGGGIGPAIQIV